ncbi:MAG: EamA family transporter [Spirochaetes bacterium]|nr:EamA family transporter [Spirochaetota bacterium]
MEPRIVLSYLAVYIIWGSTYFFIKIAVETIPPFFGVGLRFFVAGVILLLVAVATGQMKARPTLREILYTCLLSALLLIGGNGLVMVAEQSVDSYLAALLISSTPLMVTVFDRVLLGKKAGWVQIAGIIIGIAGIALLFYHPGTWSFRFSAGDILLLCAVASWALGTSLGHKFPVHENSLVNSGVQMLFAGIACLAFIAVMPGRAVDVAAGFSARSLLALGYLIFIGSLGFIAYTYLIKHEPAVRVTSYALVNPVIAVALGLLLGHEKPVAFLLPGCVLALIGLALMLYGNTIVARLRRGKTLS